MTNGFNLRRIAAAGLIAVLCAALAACFVLPGKFAETLDVRKDGRFSYSYKGEIVVLGLTKLMGMANAMGTSGNEEWTPQPCYSKKTGRERPCTKAELAKQKADWEAAPNTRAAAAKERDQQMQAMMGGLDPNDPKSGEELAVRLRKQAGWKSVVYKGDGLYEVDFQISGQLAYDFSFPTIEKLPSVLPFIAINVRGDRSVRISSPLMDQTNTGGANAMGFGAIGAMAAAEQARKQGGDEGQAGKDDFTSPIPALDGTFTLTTDAEVLANNTDDGPQADGTGKRLEWKLNIRNATPPTALLQLAK